MARYSNDPRWVEARFPGKCARCGASIAKGARAFFYPSSRSLYCAGDCGDEASADFEAAAFDEGNY